MQYQGVLPVRFKIKNHDYPIEYISMFYKLLWLTYLDEYPNLAKHASKFNNFTDMFRKSNTINCQADVVKQYVKQGRDSILEECSILIDIIEKDIIQES